MPEALRARDVGEAAEVLVASHADYPAFRAVFPDPARRERALRPFFRGTIADAVRAGVVEGERVDGRLAGVAVWLPPGAAALDTRRKLAMFPALLRVMAAAPRSFGRFARFGANVEKAHPDDAHWYLVVLGVRPEHHGRGIGRALLESGLRRADGDVYLETSDPANVAFYERFGFTVVDPALHLVPDGPPHVAMRRRA